MRICKDCVHFVSDESTEGIGDHLCLKHRTFCSPMSGCDDFWPKGRNPRCDECRFFVETVGGDLHEGRCMHSSMQTENRLGVINATGYCENWRAR